jgi:tetratricopeptide (TPR) repeat protein
LSRTIHAAAAVLLLLALAGQTVRALHRVQASRIAGAVQAQAGAAGREGRMPAPLVRGALAALERARELDPVAVEPRAFEGDLLLLAGQEEAAIEAYRRVAAHEPRPETLLHWGEALWRLGRRDEAIEQWRRVHALAPLMALRLPVPVEVLAAEPPRPLGQGGAGGRLTPPAR